MNIAETNNTTVNAAIIGRLSIERCQTHLAHLHALIHLCDLCGSTEDGLFVVESVRALIESMEKDLNSSALAFEKFN